MVDYITNTNNDILTSNTIKQQQELLGIDKKTSSKNPYDKSVDFVDQADISQNALKLYEQEKKQEKDVDKYRKIVLDSINKGLSTSDIIKQINSEKYLSNDDLADSLLNNDDFINMMNQK